MTDITSLCTTEHPFIPIQADPSPMSKKFDMGKWTHSALLDIANQTSPGSVNHVTSVAPETSKLIDFETTWSILKYLCLPYTSPSPISARFGAGPWRYFVPNFTVIGLSRRACGWDTANLSKNLNFGAHISTSFTDQFQIWRVSVHRWCFSTPLRGKKTLKFDQIFNFGGSCESEHIFHGEFHFHRHTWMQNLNYDPYFLINILQWRHPAERRQGWTRVHDYKPSPFLNSN